MLKKLSLTNEPVRLVLMADAATFTAQFNAARTLIDAELEKPSDGDFMAEVLTLVKSAVGSDQALDALKSVEGALVTLIGQKVRPAQMSKALERVRDTMKRHETREALAFVRAQLATQKYRETSDIGELLDQNPEGSAWVTIHALTPDQRRKAERAAGQKPRLGALVAGRAYDVARKATREGEDSGKAYAEYVAKLPLEEQAALDEFDEYNIRIDREVCRAGLVSVDGFDLEPKNGAFPVDDFLAECIEGGDVITETARHIRNISTLGKSANFSPSSESGTDEREGAAQP